jgi:hypothetical protein
MTEKNHKNQSTMHRRILIFFTVLAAFGLTAFGYVNLSHTEMDKIDAPCLTVASLNHDFYSAFNPLTDVELFYDVGSRYMGSVTKEDLNKAKSIYDFLPEDLNRSIVSYYSVSITILDDDYRTIVSETGDNDVLTAAQIKLLRSVDYSTNILIRAEYQEKNKDTGALEDSYTTPHLTVVPEKQAVCTNGKDALIAYVKENTNAFTSMVTEDKLQPGKVTFTVTKAGLVADATLTSTSGYPALDKKMVDLVTSMPGKWEPATSSGGEKVDQKFVFSFGIIGC